MNKKLAISIGCFVVASVLILVVYPLLLKPSVKVPAVRSTRDINFGELITADMVRVSEVSADAIHTSTAMKLEDIVGRYAVTNIFQSDVINKNAVSDGESDLKEFLYDIPSGKQVITMTIKSTASAVALRLKAGDIVSVYTKGENEVTQQYKELQYIKILAMTNALGQDVENNGDITLKEKLPTNITLLVDAKQAKQLVDIENSGVAHFSLIYRGAEEQTAEYLSMQDKLAEE